MDDAPRRTVPIKLDVLEERGGDRHQTGHQFLHCANRTSERAWRYDDYCVTSKSKAEDALYDELGEETDRTGNLDQTGIRPEVWRMGPDTREMTTFKDSNGGVFSDSENAL